MDASALQFDHVHIFVCDRPAAVAWYERVLHLKPVPSLAFWATDGGPLTLADEADRVHLALFEGQASAPRRATVALRTSGAGFAAWQEHLARELGEAPRVEDHRVAWSMYFRDPDGNPYEITTYEVAQARSATDAAATRPAGALNPGGATPAPGRP